MDQSAFSRLSKRQVECLRSVLELKGSKEIAAELGIAKATVDSYLAEAVAILGARDRKTAARMFGEYERGCPDLIGGDSVRVDAGTPNAPIAESVSEGARLGAGAGGEATLLSAPPDRSWTPPYRKGGSLRNPLTTFQRTLWIVIGAVLLAVLLAATVNIIDALGRLVQPRG